MRAIIADVAARGDRALIELTRKFDRVDLGQRRPARDGRRDRGGRRRLRPQRARRAHARARPDRGLSPPAEARRTTASPTRSASSSAHRWTAIEAVGLYVPGGTAAYPSSVLMNAVPAKVAGVPRLVMVVPAPGRQARPAGAGGGEARRRRRDLSHRRRAGGGGARLRHRRRSRRSPRSSGPATPMWRRPSASCSARSAST